MSLIKRVLIGDYLASAPSFQWRGSWLRSSPASWVGPRFPWGIGSRWSGLRMPSLNHGS